jgi:hypothetical protein
MRAVSPDAWIEAYSQVGSANKRSFQKLTFLDERGAPWVILAWKREQSFEA